MRTSYRGKRSNPTLGSMTKKVTAYQELNIGEFSSSKPRKVYTKIKSFPCELTTWSGRQYSFGAQQVNEPTHRIKVRKEFIDFDINMLIVFEWNELKFEIVRFQNLNEEDRFLFIEIRELANFYLDTV